MNNQPQQQPQQQQYIYHSPMHFSSHSMTHLPAVLSPPSGMNMHGQMAVPYPHQQQQPIHGQSVSMGGIDYSTMNVYPVQMQQPQQQYIQQQPNLPRMHMQQNSNQSQQHWQQ